jgi:hypothetical protein
MIFEGGYPKKGDAMNDQPAGRGIPADGRHATAMPEKLAGVLARIADQPGDAPVVVSAGFLRWLAKSAGEYERERDEARMVARRQKARAEAAAKLLGAADVRIDRLRGEIAALTGRPAGIEWKFGRVTADALADYELAGWDVRQIDVGRLGTMATVALRRVGIQKAAAPIEENERDTKPIPLNMPTVAAVAAPAARNAAEIEARLPQKQIDMLAQIADGAVIYPRNAQTRRALTKGGLAEIVGKPIEWSMRQTPLGAAVLAAYRARKDAA